MIYYECVSQVRFEPTTFQFPWECNRPKRLGQAFSYRRAFHWYREATLRSGGSRTPERVFLAESEPLRRAVDQHQHHRGLAEQLHLEGQQQLGVVEKGKREQQFKLFSLVLRNPFQVKKTTLTHKTLHRHQLPSIGEPSSLVRCLFWSLPRNFFSNNTRHLSSGIRTVT